MEYTHHMLNILLSIPPPPDFPAPLAWAALGVFLLGVCYFGARLMRGEK